MMSWSRLSFAAAAFAMTLASTSATAFAEGEKKGPPFGERKKPPPPKPKMRTLSVTEGGDEGKFAYTFQMTPGIPDPNQLVELILTAHQVPERPHPSYGNRVPMTNARIVIEVTSPEGQVVGRYVAHPIRQSAGKYGLHLTPDKAGVHTLSLSGTGSKKEHLSAEVRLPVAVWPLSEDLQKNEAKGNVGGRRRPIKQ